MADLFSTSSIKAEEKLLRHLFLSESLELPKEWYLQLYSEESKESFVFVHELSPFIPIGVPILIKNWNCTPSSINATTITRASIQNTGLSIFPLVPEEETWRVKYLGLWIGKPEEQGSYLLYYRIFEETLTLTTGQQYYISPGELIIYYGC